MLWSRSQNIITRVELLKVGQTRAVCSIDCLMCGSQGRCLARHFWHMTILWQQFAIYTCPQSQRLESPAVYMHARPGRASNVAVCISAAQKAAPPGDLSRIRHVAIGLDPSVKACRVGKNVRIVEQSQVYLTSSDINANQQALNG